MALAPLTVAAMKVNELNKLFESGKTDNQMPVLFLGHGSPMNAIEENEFVVGCRSTHNDVSKNRMRIILIVYSPFNKLVNV